MNSSKKMKQSLLLTLVGLLMFSSCAYVGCKEEPICATNKKNITMNFNCGEMHNNLLDECFDLCNAIDPNEYLVESEMDEDYYELYATYSNIITEHICSYIEIVNTEETIIPNGQDGLLITTPQEFAAYYQQKRENIENMYSFGLLAIQGVESLFEQYFVLLETDIEEATNYWNTLCDDVDLLANDIYAQCEAQIETEEEKQALEHALSIMIGSFRYWSDEDRISAWQNLAWHANNGYLYAQEQEDENKDNNDANGNNNDNNGEGKEDTTELKRKVVEFVYADFTTGLAASSFGPHAAVAAGGFGSALIALSW